MWVSSAFSALLGIDHALAAEVGDGARGSEGGLGQALVDDGDGHLVEGEEVALAEGGDELAGGPVASALGVDDMRVGDGGDLDPALPAEVELEAFGTQGADEEFVGAAVGKGEVADLLVAKLDDVAHHDALEEALLGGIALGLEVDERASLAQLAGKVAETCLGGIEEEDVGREVERSHEAWGLVAHTEEAALGKAAPWRGGSKRGGGGAGESVALVGAAHEGGATALAILDEAYVGSVAAEVVPDL